MRRVFNNGTIAIYFNGVLISYEVAPTEFYLDVPRNDYPDGSYEVFFLNGTKRYYPGTTINATNSAEFNRSLLYSDCMPSGECNFYYRNGTMAVYSGGRFRGTQKIQVTPTPRPVPPSPPPPPPPPPSIFAPQTTYTYVNKTGPKKQVYDPSQGGIKKYKEQYQTNDERASKSSSAEPLCKWRNQVVIIGDKRISDSVYIRGGRERRNMQVTSNDGPTTLSLSVQTVTFKPESFAMGPLSSLSIVIVSAFTLLGYQLIL